MSLAGALEIQLFAGIARLQSDMNQATRVVGGAAKNIESAVASAKSALASLGIGLGVGYFASLIKGTIDAADKFNDLTQSMGINRQELAKYQLATAQSGTTLEGLGKGIKGLTNAFAEHGNELRAAGINAKTADGQVRQLADIFSKMPDGLEKTTLATKLFGKSGMELIPMLNMGAAGLDEAAQKSAKYAAVMATLAPQADKFNDTMTELGMASKVAGMSLINDALPAMTGIAAAMAVAAHESGSLKAAWVGFGGIAWEGVFKPLSALIMGTTANLMELNAKMLQFFGASEGAAYEFQRAARMWEKVAALESVPPTPQAQKKFDTDAWTEQYKKLVGALGLGKKATDDSESAFRRLMKTLDEKMLGDAERTEFAKLELDLQYMSEKELNKLTGLEIERLTIRAKEVDASIAAKKAIEDETKKLMEYAAWLEKVTGELAAAEAQEDVARNNAIMSASKQIEQMVLETSLIGATNVERETAIFLRQAEIDKIDEATIARGKEAIAAKHAAQEVNDSQVDMWKSVESAGHQAFLSIFDTSKSVLERIRAMLKTHLIDILYQVTFKKWIVNIAVGTSGAGVAQAALGSAGSPSDGASITTLLSGANSVGSILGGPTLTTALSNFGGAFATYTTMVGEGAGAMSALSASTAGLGASFATLIPYVGLAIAAYYLLTRDHGRPAVSTGDLGRYFSAAGAQTGEDWTTFGAAGAEPMVTSLQQRYAQAVASLGGTAAASNFYFGSNTGADSENPMFRLAGGAGGLSFDTGAEIAMDNAALDLAASRAILTALQGSNLPEYLARYLDTLTAGTLDQAAINNAMAFAQALHQIHDGLTETRPAVQVLTDSAAELATQLATSAATFKRDFLAAIDAGITPEALANWQRLAGIFDAINASLMGLVDAASAAQDAVHASLERVSGIMGALGEDVRRTAADLASARADIYDSLTGFGDSISDFLTSLRTSGAATSASSFTALKDLFLSTATLAKAGDVTSQGKVLGIAGPLIEAMRERSTSAVDFARQQATVVSVLEEIEVATAAQAALLAPLAGAAAPETLQSRLVAAQQANIRAIETYNRAVELTAGLQLTERTALSDLIDELGTLRAAQDAFGVAQTALADGLTLSGMTAVDFAARLGLAGAAATAFVAMVNGLLTVNAGGGAVASQAYSPYTQNEIQNYVFEKGINLNNPSEAYAEAVRLNANPYAVGAAYGYDAAMVDAYLAGGGVQRIRGFAEGTPSVPFDMTARIHRNERIIPAASNDELVSEIKAMRAAVERLEKPAKDTADATSKTKNELQQVVRGGLSLQTRAAGT